MDGPGVVGVPAQVDAVLLPGERTLWVGRPDPSALFRRADLFLVPFSLFWAGGVVVWMVSAIRMGAPLLFLLGGVPFTLVALYITVGRLWWRRRELRRTTYVLTDRRALDVRPGRVSAEPATSGPSEVRTSADARRMTVTYGPVGGPAGYYRQFNLMPGLVQDSGVVFENVTDVAGLTHAVRRAASQER